MHRSVEESAIHARTRGRGFGLESAPVTPATKPKNKSSARRRNARAPHEDFGARLASFRTAAALTQSELAERVGVSRRQIAYYESGTGRPPGALLSLLADLFEVSTDVLLGREVPKAPADRLSRALLVQLRRAERLGSDVCRRLEHVLEQFVAEEERKRGAPGTRGRARGTTRPERARPGAARAAAASKAGGAKRRQRARG